MIRTIGKNCSQGRSGAGCPPTGSDVWKEGSNPGELPRGCFFSGGGHGLDPGCFLGAQYGIFPPFCNWQKCQYARHDWRELKMALLISTITSAFSCPKSGDRKYRSGRVGGRTIAKAHFRAHFSCATCARTGFRSSGICAFVGDSPLLGRASLVAVVFRTKRFLSTSRRVTLDPRLMATWKAISRLLCQARPRLPSKQTPSPKSHLWQFER